MYLSHKETINMPCLLISLLWKQCESFERYLLKKHILKKNESCFFSIDDFYLIKNDNKKQDVFL